MNANGTGQTNLSNDASSASEINPAYGPDGSIVFVRAPAGTFNICTQRAVNQGRDINRHSSDPTHNVLTHPHALGTVMISASP